MWDGWSGPRFQGREWTGAPPMGALVPLEQGFHWYCWGCSTNASKRGNHFMTRRKTRVFAITNQKGGVGKSTTTYHLARAATLLGLKVLCVDIDPQGNLTSVLSPDFAEGDVGLADALSSRADETLGGVITDDTIWEGVDLVPTAGESLGYVRDELVLAGAGRESRLRESLDQVKGEYDLILIDCAPSLDQLTINGLTAADEVLIVTQSKLWSANGLARLLGTVDSVREHYNHDLAIAGILINQHEGKTLSGAHWYGELAEAAEARHLKVLTPPIPKRVAISDAHESGIGLDESSSKDAREMADLYAIHLSTIIEGK